MIKYITLIIILFTIMVSCGKKGDPKYESSNKKEMLTFSIKKI